MSSSSSSSSSTTVMNALISGAAAGTAAKSVVAPFDRVKLLFQVSRERFSIRAAVMKAITLTRSEGLASLWKGNTAVVLRVVPATAVNYAAYVDAKMRLREAGVSGWSASFTAGALAGAARYSLTHAHQSLSRTHLSCFLHSVVPCDVSLSVCLCLYELIE